MRRAILAAAVIGLTSAFGGVDTAQAQVAFSNGDFGISIGGGGAGGPYAGGSLWSQNGYYGYPRGNGYGPYGPGHRGGYGANGYAPTFGPVWGTSAFYPQPNIPRSHRSGGAYSSYSNQGSSSVARSGVGLPIKIVSPDDAGAAISYSLNEFDYTIAPGESQLITNDREWVITFDRGGDFGTARYTLAPGLYTFGQTETGWQVYHDADIDKVTKTNAAANKIVVKNELPARK